MLDLWLLWFSASYSTLAQFMMNYGNEWDMDLILSYVGTQIWGTAEYHVLLLTSRKSCLVTSRGRLVHEGNTGWAGKGARLYALVAGENSRPRFGAFWIVVVRHPLAQLCHCLSAAVFEAWAPHGVIRRLTTIAAKTNGLLDNTTSDMLRVQSLRR